MEEAETEYQTHAEAAKAAKARETSIRERLEGEEGEAKAASETAGEGGGEGSGGPKAGSFARKILDVVGDNPFIGYAALAREVYGEDTPQNRKKLRGLNYLETRNELKEVSGSRGLEVEWVIPA